VKAHFTTISTLACRRWFFCFRWKSCHNTLILWQLFLILFNPFGKLY